MRLNVLFLFLFFLTSCCSDVTNVGFTSEESSWIPEGQSGDSIAYNSGDSLKLWYKIWIENATDHMRCEGPFCCDHEDTYNYRYQMGPDWNQWNNQGFTIDLTKQGNFFTKKFIVQCRDTYFTSFDSVADSMVIRGVTYKEVMIKHFDSCDLSGLYFTKKKGVIKFTLNGLDWERE